MSPIVSGVSEECGSSAPLCSLCHQPLYTSARGQQEQHGRAAYSFPTEPEFTVPLAICTVSFISHTEKISSPHNSF